MSEEPRVNSGADIFVCIYNPKIDCSLMKCDRCGWNPAVIEQRKDKNKGKLQRFITIEDALKKLQETNFYYPLDGEIFMKALLEIKPRKVEEITEVEANESNA